MFFFFFPTGFDRPVYRRPIATLVFLGLNTLVFIAQIVVTLALHRPPSYLIEKLGFTSGTNEYWRLLTHAFVHGGFMHFLFNMLYLVVTGFAVENRIGPWRTSVIYIAGAVCGGALHSIVQPVVAGAMPLVGASGAIAALMGAFFILMPWADIRISYFYFIIFGFHSGTGVYKCPAWIFLGLYFFLTNLLYGIVSREDAGVSVAYWAHIGGFAFGAVMAAALYGLRAFGRTDFEQQSVEERERENSLPPEEKEKLERAANPIDPSALIRFIRVKYSSQAEAEYRRLLQQNPQCSVPPEPQLELAHMLVENGSLDLALTALNNLIDLYPRSAQCRVALLEAAEVALRIAEKRPQAFGYLNRFITMNPSRDEQERAQQLLGSLNSELSKAETGEFMPEYSPEGIKDRPSEKESMLPRLSAAAEATPPLPLYLPDVEMPPAEEIRKTPVGFGGAKMPLVEEVDDSPLVLDISDGFGSHAASPPRSMPRTEAPPRVAPDDSSSPLILELSHGKNLSPSAGGLFDTTADAFTSRGKGGASRGETTHPIPSSSGPKFHVEDDVPHASLEQSRARKPEAVHPEAVSAADMLNDDDTCHIAASAIRRQPPHRLPGVRHSEVSASLILAPGKPVDFPKLLSEIADHANVPPVDMAVRIRAQAGILFSDIKSVDGRRMRGHLGRRGIGLCLIENSPEYDMSEVVEVQGLDSEGGAWIWESAGEQFRSSAGYLTLIGCGGFRLDPNSHRLSCALDLFQCEPRLHLRLWASDFRFANVRGLKGFALEEGIGPILAMRMLADCLMRESPNAVPTYALSRWFDPKASTLPRRFPDVATYDAYNRWHLLACHGREID